MAKTHVTMKVNGAEVEGLVEPRALLVHFIRENLQMTGTHIGCEHGVSLIHQSEQHIDRRCHCAWQQEFEGNLVRGATSHPSHRSNGKRHAKC